MATKNVHDTGWYRLRSFEYRPNDWTFEEASPLTDGAALLEKLALKRSNAWRERVNFWLREQDQKLERKRQMEKQLKQLRDELGASNFPSEPDAQSNQSVLQTLRWRLSEVAITLTRNPTPRQRARLEKEARSITQRLAQLDKFEERLRVEAAQSRPVEMEQRISRLKSEIEQCHGEMIRASEQAAWWDRFSWGPGAINDLLTEFVRVDTETHEAVFELAKADSKAAQVAAEKVEFYVDELITLASLGQKSAAQAVCQLAIRIGQIANRIAVSAPAIASSVAARSPVWPVIKTRQTCQSPEERALAENIQLGSDYPALFAPETRKKTHDIKGRIALQLLEYVHKERAVLRRLWPEDRDLSTALETRIMELPEFSEEEETAKKWWAVAKQCLKEAYPDPRSIPHFQEVVSENKRKIPGRFNSQFFYEIGRRFLTLRTSREYPSVPPIDRCRKQ